MTVRIKVLVLIDEKGKYSASGFTEHGQPAGLESCRGIVDMSLEEMSPVTRYVWLTADVELPEVPVMHAAVEACEVRP